MLLEPSDGELQQSRCWGPPAPHGPPLWWGSAQLRAWHTTSPLTASSCRASAAHFQRRGALSLAGDPHALSEGSRRSLHAGEGARPLWLRGRRGRRAQVQASDPWPPHTDPPAPLQPTRAPEPEGAPLPRSRRAPERASQFRPAHRRTTARARRAPAEPLHGSLFDSSHPDIPAPPPRARASRSARGWGAGSGKVSLEPGPPFTCRIFDVGEGDRPP